LRSELNTANAAAVAAELAKTKAIADSTATGEVVVKMMEGETLLQGELKAAKERNARSEQEIAKLKADLAAAQEATAAAVAAAAAGGGGGASAAADLKDIMQAVYEATCERFEGAEGLSSKDVVKQMKLVLKQVTASRA
jgi:tellurite resistance protein